MHLFRDLKIFPKDTLEILINNYKVPNFNQEYLSKRKNMVEYHFLKQELKWTIVFQIVPYAS